MKITSIKEISVAVKNLDQAISDFKTKLQLQPEEVQVVEPAPGQSRFASFRIGDCSIALVSSTAPDSPIARFLERRGEGIFSITLAVDSIIDATQHFKSQGVQMVLDEPMVLKNERAVDKIYGEALINFTRPQSLHGVLFEILELRD